MHRLGGLFALPKALREETSLSANLSSSAAPTQPSRWGPFGYVAFTVIWTASVVSNVGTAMFDTASGWVAREPESDSLPVVLLLFDGGVVFAPDLGQVDRGRREGEAEVGHRVSHDL